MEKELIEKIEELNLEIIDLKSDRIYSLGKKIDYIISQLKSLRIINAIKKIIDSRKIKKYNAHGELANDYSYVSVPKLKNAKIAVYSCITGNYDEIKEPFLISKNVDYYLFTDNSKLKSKNWIIKKIPQRLKKYNNILINRYIKMHPYEFFSEYDYAIYVDGNVKIISNIRNLIYSVYKKKSGISMHRHQFRNCIYKEIEVCRIRKKGNYEKMKAQTLRYKEFGFPKEFGMLEAGIIVSDLKNNNAINLLDDWWIEFENSESMRDQISLHYVIWNSGYTMDDIGSLGNNMYKNPVFRIRIH